MAHLQIGCDVARFGDDATVIHAQSDGRSIFHESYRLRDTAFTAERLKQVCRNLAPPLGLIPWCVPCLIDDTGVGGGVVDQKRSPPSTEELASYDPVVMRGRCYRFVPVNAGQQAQDPTRYPNARSECLFLLAERMQAGLVDLSALSPSVQQEIKRQAIMITYRLDSAGRRVVERKDITKDRISRSPDDLDAVALAYSSYVANGMSESFGVRCDRRDLAGREGRDPFARESRGIRWG